jgi:dCTP diphosphatase
MAMTVEAAELMEIFQWLTLEESNNLSAEKRHDLSEELGDVFVYLLRLADKADVDLIEVARAKMEKNRLKYPAEKVRGSSKKYSEYEFNQN